MLLNENFVHPEASQFTFAEISFAESTFVSAIINILCQNSELRKKARIIRPYPPTINIVMKLSYAEPTACDEGGFIIDLWAEHERWSVAINWSADSEGAYF